MNVAHHISGVGKHLKATVSNLSRHWSSANVKKSLAEDLDLREVSPAQLDIAGEVLAGRPRWTSNLKDLLYQLLRSGGKTTVTNLEKTEVFRR